MYILGKNKLSIRKRWLKKFWKNMIALNVFNVKNEKNRSCLGFKTKLKAWKTSYSFNDYKQKRMALYCSKKSIVSFMKNYVKIILKFNQYQKSDKAQFVIYADL